MLYIMCHRFHYIYKTFYLFIWMIFLCLCTAHTDNMENLGLHANPLVCYDAHDVRQRRYEHVPQNRDVPVIQSNDDPALLPTVML